MRATDIQTVFSNLARVQEVQQHTTVRTDIVSKQALMDAQKREEVRDKSILQSEETQYAEIHPDEKDRREKDRSGKNPKGSEDVKEDDRSHRPAVDEFRGHVLDVEA